MVNQTYTRLAPYTSRNRHQTGTPSPTPTPPPIQTSKYVSNRHLSHNARGQAPSQFPNNIKPNTKTNEDNNVESSTSMLPYSTRRKLVLSKYHSKADGSWPWSIPTRHNQTNTSTSSSTATASNHTGSESPSTTHSTTGTSSTIPEYTYYDNWLLTLAIDLGERLLPAFNTDTGMFMYSLFYYYQPYGIVIINAQK